MRFSGSPPNPVRQPVSTHFSPCFWEEAQKIQKINEKKANELIELFIKNKTSKYIEDEEYHPANCCCVIHLRKKVKETKDNNKTIQNIITNVNVRCINKEKEKNNQ